ncbi:AAA family ATPase [Croceicoccus gelatinilyticus]|uniref:SF1B family DNA helicase RecD2 n=1 Tax=Croceicoccus gelatinilyticus TaxID=2835536 RepID=UPI001BCE4069|nr:AAA family ATPase [Croceicoccus gelatinilyticus]MBS7671715.1 AAA family ATPase [Croceicoccus gelatinilyticus]
MAAAASKTGKAFAGRIERFLSGPSADGFAIVKLTTRSGNLTIKGRGTLASFRVGEAIQGKGTVTVHPRFGTQIDVTDAWAADEGAAGLTRWIAEAGFEGIGPARAKQIVESLGANALEQIVQGTSAARSILAARFPAVQAYLAPRYAEATAGALLASYGIGKTMRDKVYAVFGAETIQIVKEDPYALITRVEGIAFKTADDLAKAAGIDTASSSRILAAAVDALRTEADEGHSWTPLSTIISQAASRTGLSVREVADLVAEECPDGVAIITIGDGEDCVRGWAIDKIARREEALARRLLQMTRRDKVISKAHAEDLVARHSAAIGIELNEQQRMAAITALCEPVAIITGLPGTGKTTVLEVITLAWKELRRATLLASPTGKAAQRMAEATKLPAETVHRMLGVEDGQFVHNASNPLDAQSIAIDESSMLDISLAYSMVSAVGGAQLLLLGDPEQLPSVDAGRVLGDLVDTGVIPTVRLTEVRRQAEGSLVAAGAAAVRAGEMPEWGPGLEFVEVNDNEDIANAVLALHAAETATTDDVQILAPGHAAECGTRALNAELSNKGKGPSARVAGGAEVCVGDKVIQTINDGERQVFNGDTGVVVAIDVSSAAITVEMCGPTPRTLEYTGTKRGDLAPAWALSIHKAQGSEYETVIIPMTCSHWRLLRRSLINTGITRAKKRCIIVGQKRAIRQAIANNDARSRRTRLAALLNR